MPLPPLQHRDPALRITAAERATAIWTAPELLRLFDELDAQEPTADHLADWTKKALPFFAQFQTAHLELALREGDRTRFTCRTSHDTSL